MTGRGPTVSSVVVGPDHHGVVRHALSVAAATDVRVVRATRPSAVRASVGRDVAVVHLHFTDRLFGPDATSSGEAFDRVADRLRGRRVVTLHDIPEPAGTARAGRLIATYRRVARRADVLVVCSDHERRRLREIGVDGETTVIPLPIAPVTADRPPRPSQAGGPERTVGVLGFIYPGKGHDAVLAAVATLSDTVAVVALGGASAGHDDLVAALHETARRTGRRLSVSGYLDDVALSVAMDLVDVPVVPASATSASSSLCTWIAAGRRPLVAANGFTCEVAAMAPDLLTLYRRDSPDELAAAIRQALDDPPSTWHGGAIPAPLRTEDVAAQHVALYRRLAARP